MSPLGAARLRELLRERELLADFLLLLGDFLASDRPRDGLLLLEGESVFFFAGVFGFSLEALELRPRDVERPRSLVLDDMVVVTVVVLLV